MRSATKLSLAICATVWAAPIAAQQGGGDNFATGPVFEDFGPHAEVEGVAPFAADAEFAHSFDVAKNAEGETRNRGFESAARFVNMHVANGVDPDNIAVAVVVHGSAVFDLLTDEARAARDFGETNPSADMVRAMLAEGVRFIVCGQSAAGQDVAREDLIEGVEMDLSAMTAHARLQQAGYTVNPF